MRRSVLLAIVGMLPLVGNAQLTTPSDPGNQQLEQTRLWLNSHPPDGSNATQRREKMAVVQAAADRLTPEAFKAWESACVPDTNAADSMEKSGILYYWNRTTDAAIREIHQTKVERGMAVWHLYNMGYVFKTSDACFGIDLRLRDGQRLASDLDFLLVSHAHNDHVSVELMEAMIKAGKPVITSWYPGTTIVPIRSGTTQPSTRPGEFHFGAVRVRVEIGDHHRNDPTQVDNMLMYQVGCGPAAGNSTIYHSGDGSNPEKMHPDRPVDVMIFHVAVGLPVEESIRRINPKMALVSHVLELGHSPKPPQAWRWSYDYAFNTFRGIPETQATVLTWGERWLLPGTVISK